MSSRPQLPALHRAVEVMELIATTGQGAGFSQISNALGDEVPPSTVSRLLGAMIDSGLLVQDEQRRYAVGTRLQSLARVLVGGAPIGDLLLPSIRRLAELTGESAAAFVIEAEGHALVAKHELPERFRYMAIGRMLKRGNVAHGFGRMLEWGGPGPRPTVLVNREDDQPGLARIVACPVDGVAIGVSCIAAGLDSGRAERLARQVRASADSLSSILESK
jgi:DNA-binding IclR family transcriptional regulator